MTFPGYYIIKEAQPPPARTLIGELFPKSPGDITLSAEGRPSYLSAPRCFLSLSHTDVPRHTYLHTQPSGVAEATSSVHATGHVQ